MRRGAARRIRVVEAPVSGSARDIDAGNVTVLLDGAPDDMAAATGTDRAYGDPVLPIGLLSSAMAVKLLIQRTLRGPCASSPVRSRASQRPSEWTWRSLGGDLTIRRCQQPGGWRATLRFAPLEEGGARSTRLLASSTSAWGCSATLTAKVLWTSVPRRPRQLRVGSRPARSDDRAGVGVDDLTGDLAAFIQAQEPDHARDFLGACCSVGEVLQRPGGGASGRRSRC